MIARIGCCGCVYFKRAIHFFAFSDLPCVQSMPPAKDHCSCMSDDVREVRTPVSQSNVLHKFCYFIPFPAISQALTPEVRARKTHPTVSFSLQRKALSEPQGHHEWLCRDITLPSLDLLRSAGLIQGNCQRRCPIREPMLFWPPGGRASRGLLLSPYKASQQGKRHDLGEYGGST